MDVYDPFQIVRKTKGRVFGDSQSLERMRKDWVWKCDAILKESGDETDKKKRLYSLLMDEKGQWEATDEKG